MDMNIIADKQSMPMKAEVTMHIAKPNQVTDIKMPSFKDYPKADFNAENFLTDFEIQLVIQFNIAFLFNF